MKNSKQKLTNSQNSIEQVSWSDDDKYLAFTSFVEKTKDHFIEMPEKPKGAKWNDPAIEIDNIKLKKGKCQQRKPVPLKEEEEDQFQDLTELTLDSQLEDFTDK